ncbi:MAG: hypothetical protein M0Q91_02160 [Methanoregula sp.]|jgi:hypothetical protein|nr:hypothetical protein [Methanoregula sp.]
MTGIRKAFSKRVSMMRKSVLVLVVLSLVGIVFLSGCVGQQPTTPATTVTTVSGTQTLVSGTQVSGNLTVKPTVQVTIPAKGVFVKVSYLGAFNGTYGMNGEMQQVKNSGDRVYEITNATGNVTATFFKQDASTTHDITVGLWKNGVLLTSAMNSTSFGKVSFSYKV